MDELMSEPKRRFFSGDTLQQALVQAANYYNLSPEEVEYRSIEKRHGFLKARRRIVIEVDPDSPRRAEPAALPPGPTRAPRPAQPVETATSLRREAPVAAPQREEEAEGPPRREAESRREAPQGGAEEPPRRDGVRETRDRRPERRRREGGDRHRERRGGFDREARRGDGRGPRREPAPERRPGERPARVLEGAPASGVVVEPEPEIDLDDSLITLPERPRPVGDRYPVASGPVAEAAQKGLDLLLGVANLRLSSRIHQGEGRLEVDLAGEDADFCFDEEGEVLRAIEHLLPRVIRSLSGEAIPCRVDCESFHEIREEQLRSLAQRVAAEVRRRGRPRVLDPMNPADRRIVHMTLADDPGVETESEGEGYFKRVVVRPL